MSSTSFSRYHCASAIKRDLTRAALASRAVVMLAVSVLLPGQAWAATHWVDAAAAPAPPGTGCGTSAGYTTIQAAVDAAAPGDTIRVCAGTYPEAAGGPLTINKTLTLLGAQSGIDARSRVGPESIVTDVQGTYVTANNVIIDGFTPRQCCPET